MKSTFPTFPTFARTLMRYSIIFIALCLVGGAAGLEVGSFQACSVDVETLKCDATDVFSCLEANKDVLVASCSTYLTAMDKCYSDVKVFRNTIFATTECKVQTARS